MKLASRAAGAAVVLALATAGVVAATAGVVAAVAVGCNDNCPSGACSPPVFDLAMGRMNDLWVVRDLTITSAGVVTVGAGAANAFAPATVTIQAGQSVTWTWVSGVHSVVSESVPKAFDDSPQQAAGQYTVMFATPGTYAYHCGVHGAMMSGTVVVQ